MPLSRFVKTAGIYLNLKHFNSTQGLDNYIFFKLILIYFWKIDFSLDCGKITGQYFFFIPNKVNNNTEAVIENTNN